MRFGNCNGIVYIVEPGDTLYSISRKFRISLEVILRANPYLDVYNLYPGLQICIPIPGGIGPVRPYPPINVTPIPGRPGRPGRPERPERPERPNRPWEQPPGRPNQPGSHRPGGRTPYWQEQGERPRGEGDEGEEDTVQRLDFFYSEGEQPPTLQLEKIVFSEELGDEGNVIKPEMPKPKASDAYLIISYVVPENESLKTIMDKFGLNIDDIIRHNKLENVEIKPGSIVRVPNWKAMDEEKFDN